MPIHVRVSHHDRHVVAVAHGTISGEELTNAVREFVEQGALPYRKIVDVAAANSPADMPPLKHLLALNEGGERPVRVFTNLHEARKWLDEIFKIEMKR